MLRDHQNLLLKHIRKKNHDVEVHKALLGKISDLLMEYIENYKINSSQFLVTLR